MADHPLHSVAVAAQDLKQAIAELVDDDPDLTFAAEVASALAAALERRWWITRPRG